MDLELWAMGSFAGGIRRCAAKEEVLLPCRSRLGQAPATCRSVPEPPKGCMAPASGILTFGASARMLESWSSTRARDRQKKQTYPATGMAYPGYAGSGGGWGLGAVEVLPLNAPRLI